MSFSSAQKWKFAESEVIIRFALDASHKLPNVILRYMDSCLCTETSFKKQRVLYKERGNIVYVCAGGEI